MIFLKKNQKNAFLIIHKAARRRSQTAEKLIEEYRAIANKDAKSAEDLLPFGLEVIARD